MFVTLKAGFLQILYRNLSALCIFVLNFLTLNKKKIIKQFQKMYVCIFFSLVSSQLPNMVFISCSTEETQIFLALIYNLQSLLCAEAVDYFQN